MFIKLLLKEKKNKYNNSQKNCKRLKKIMKKKINNKNRIKIKKIKINQLK